MRIFSKFMTVFWLAFIAGTMSASAQEKEEKSTLITFVEDQLSAPNRQISLNGLEGTLSSNVSLDSITIADKRGVWLKITKPKLVWNRTALLRGKLDIESLTAESIDYLRNADVDESLPAPEASSFKLPELPVAVVIENISIPRIAFDQSVFGLKSEAAVAGKVSLENGALDLDLAIDRKDGPGGTFKVVAQHSNETNVLALDVALDEPENGILANLLNLEGRPPVSLKIKGKNPISDLRVALAFDVAKRRILSGELRLAKADAGTRAIVDLGGPLASILPERMRDFFGPQSRIDADALFADDGSIALDKFDLNSGAVVLNASARQLADGFLSALQLDLALMPQGRNKVFLPTPDVETSLSSGRLLLNYDAEKNNAWYGQLSVGNFERAGIEVDAVTLTSNGTVTGINIPSDRAVTFNLNGKLDGFLAQDPALNEAVGKSISLVGGGEWKTGMPLLLNRFQILGETFKLVSTGEFADLTFNGSIELYADRLAAFSSLAKRQLRGRTLLRADGKIQPASGAFDLRLNGTTSDLSIGEPSIDLLLSEDTTIAGGVVRDDKGLEFRKFRVANRKFESDLDGRFASDESNLSAQALLRNMATITKRASGALSLKANLKGTQKPFDLSLEVGVEDGQLSGRDIEQLNLTFKGVSDLESVKGTLSSSGQLDGQPVRIGGNIAADQKTANLQNLFIDVGQAKISGELTRAENGLLDADLSVDADNIIDLAALALVNATGAVKGSVQLRAENGKQAGNANLDIKSLRYETYRLESAAIEAEFQDMFGAPVIDGKIAARDIRAAGVEVRTLDGTVKTMGEKTSFDIRAALAKNATKIKTNGEVIQRDGAMVVSLNELNVDSNITSARLKEPTQMVIRDGSVQLSQAAIAIGDGSFVVTGNAGSRLDLTADIQSVQLSIINSIRPQTEAAGTLSGRIEINGTPSELFAVFDISGEGVMAAQLNDAGVAPLSGTARGRIANNSVELDSVTVRNGQNIDLAASGTIPLSGGGLSVNAEGTLPLSIVEAQLASRGATLTGFARVKVRVAGSLVNPDASGLIAIQDATLIDPLSNLKLSAIGVLASIDGNTVTLNRAQGSLSTGGSVSASGTVRLVGDLPVNLNLVLNDARYTDGQTFSTQASGRLSLTGFLNRNPLLGGNIELGKTEITVPETFAKDGKLLEVRHVRPSPKIRQTLARLRRASPVPRPTSRPSVVQLDITINAPNQIFVRGRGLDAELGGSIRIQGSATNVRPIGNFTLRRGRLSILGQRIDLDEGTITLAGDLDPVLNLIARTDAGDVEAFITLTGRVSDLEVKFTSSPELPEDEVLALIIFGRGLGDLSPAQIVRLASIASELTGGNSPGLVDGIRKGTGLDDLDVVQDSDGNAAVKAGKYISDKVYLGVQAGKKTEATINLDITDNVKLRGAVGSEGSSSIGIFLERDY